MPYPTAAAIHGAALGGEIDAPCRHDGPQILVCTAGAVTVRTAAGEQQVPILLRVFPFTIPAAGRAAGNLLTSFHVSPQSYVKPAATLYGMVRQRAISLRISALNMG